MKVNRKAFQDTLSQTFDSIRKLSASKGVEYTGHEGEANVHANFDRLSNMLQMPSEKILMVYLTKHLDSITTYVNSVPAKPMRSLSEPIESRIDDAILYLILLKSMVWREGSHQYSVRDNVREIMNENWDVHTDVPR